jgi:hypothetical protein
MQTRSRTLAVAVTTAALVLAACGGADDTSPDDGDVVDDDAAAGSDDAEDAGTADAEEDEPADEDEAVDGDEAEGDGSDGAEGSEASADLLAGVAFGSEPQRIEYSIQGERQGMPASLTIAHDGTRVATYTTVEESGQTLETAAFIDDGEGVAFCIKESGNWSCFEQGGMEDQVIEETSIDEGELSDYLADAYRDEIAGREAICGTNTGFSQADGGDVCVDAKTGVLLRLDLGAATGETLIMEAVSVTTASEEDFTPPAEPGSFGG